MCGDSPSFFKLFLVLSLIITWLPPRSLAQREMGNHQTHVSNPSAEAPQLFGRGVISTREYELTTTFTPDGKTAYFTVSTASYGKLHTILVTRHVGGAWSTPEVAPFSGRWSDADPFVSSDGKRLYFISNRPALGTQPKRDYDIYVVERKDSDWGEPRNVGAPVNSDASELYVTATRDDTLYFVASRPDSLGQGDVYRSRLIDGHYSEPENLGEAINSPQHDTTPCISADESYLVFASGNRSDGHGDLDLYISYRRAGQWTQAVNLGRGINSSARDYCPIVSPDGKYLFFSSERGFTDSPRASRLTYTELVSNLSSVENGLGNVYRVSLKGLL